MSSSILATHIIGAITSFIVAGALIRVTLHLDREAIRRYLSILALCMVFDGATGVLLAISSGAPAFSVCDNIAYYVIVFAGTVFFSSRYPIRARMIQVPVMRPFLLGTIVPFIPALFATLFGF